MQIDTQNLRELMNAALHNADIRTVTPKYEHASTIERAARAISHGARLDAVMGVLEALGDDGDIQ